MVITINLSVKVKLTTLILIIAIHYTNCLKTREDLEKDFFQSIAGLSFDPEDIKAMYKNVTAEIKTANCTKCRTPVALWVIHSIVPCYKPEKSDCPQGFVCCSNAEASKPDIATTMSPTEDTYTTFTFPIQDRIPDDVDIDEPENENL